MRSVVACVIVGVLAAALTSATPALAETSAPTFDPNPVVLGAVAQPVSGTVHVEEADGLTLASARVYDPSCALTWDSLPVDSNCPVWMHDDANSKVGNVRTVDLSGAIPLRDSTGALVDRPTTYVTVVYTDGSHEYVETGLVIYAAPAPTQTAPAPAPPVVATTPPGTTATGSTAPASVTRPSAPRRAHAASASRRATLSWAPPARSGGAAVDHYQVRLGTSSSLRSLPPTARRFTFTGLRNGSLVRLSVRAHNAKGFSGWVAARARPHAPPRPRHFANCAALTRIYPHGVGRPGARDRGSSVTNFTRALATYRLNVDKDRDRDGIACEKK